MTLSVKGCGVDNEFSVVFDVSDVVVDVKKLSESKLVEEL